VEADLKGSQRKVVSMSVRPLRASHGYHGVAVRGGSALPFVVTRQWSAPAGHYPERFYVVDPTTREILFEGPEQVPLMWGLQGLTEVVDEVHDPFSLEPDTYLMVFALGGAEGGEFEFDAVTAPAP
jgi:hypothetical protein